jgi:hypothetical protein
MAWAFERAIGLVCCYLEPNPSVSGWAWCRDPSNAFPRHLLGAGLSAAAC